MTIVYNIHGGPSVCQAPCWGFKNIIIKTYNLLISSKQPHKVEHITILILHMQNRRVQKVKVLHNQYRVDLVKASAEKRWHVQKSFTEKNLLKVLFTAVWAELKELPQMARAWKWQEWRVKGAVAEMDVNGAWWGQEQKRGATWQEL